MFDRCYLISILLLVSVLMIPLIWTLLTVVEENPHTGLPNAFSGVNDGLRQPPNSDIENRFQNDLIEFLSTNTQEIYYLAAVSNANTGAPFVLATGRPVLYMGGFNGKDPVVDAEKVMEMTADRELRYFYYQNIDQENDQEIKQWLRTSCRVVKEFTKPLPRNQNQDNRKDQPSPILFDCFTYMSQ